MVTDINIKFERFENGKWVYIPDIDKELDNLNIKNKEEFWKYLSFPEIRNYEMFALLGNVRNYAKVESLFDCKGIPEDISDELIENNHWFNWENWDSYNHSWFTLEEFENIDWNVKELNQRKNLPIYETRKELMGIYTEHEFNYVDLLIQLMKSLCINNNSKHIRMIFCFD